MRAAAESVFHLFVDRAHAITNLSIFFCSPPAGVGFYSLRDNELPFIARTN